MGLFSASLAAFLSGVSLSASETDFKQTLSPHFTVFHEAAFMPPGLILSLESLHNRLRVDLSMFAPWMAKERVSLYLYQSRESYLRGKFRPPRWSNGIADSEKKLIAVFDRDDREQLKGVLAHELTHLFFEGYWQENSRESPPWLNEGLAMLEEAGAAGAHEDSNWFRSMSLFSQTPPIPFDKFLALHPSKDIGSDQDQVTVWYVQAYSVVYYLYRRHSRLQFFQFCRSLKEGVDLESALRLSYRINGTLAFEKSWRAWLSEPAMKRALSEYHVSGYPAKSAEVSGKKGEARSGEGRRKALKPVGFAGFDFHRLR